MRRQPGWTKFSLMLSYNVHAAKTNFSKLLAEVARGREVVICRAGNPVAVVKPFRPSKPRRLGLAKGKVKVAKDFDVLPQDLLDGFLGNA